MKEEVVDSKIALDGVYGRVLGAFKCIGSGTRMAERGFSAGERAVLHELRALRAQRRVQRPGRLPQAVHGPVPRRGAPAHRH